MSERPSNLSEWVRFYSCSQSGLMREAARIVGEHLERQQQSPPARVLKPLVWEDRIIEGLHNSSDAKTQIFVLYRCFSRECCWRPESDPRWEHLHDCDSIEHGKDLALADYRERVEALFEKGGEG